MSCFGTINAAVRTRVGAAMVPMNQSLLMRAGELRAFLPPSFPVFRVVIPKWLAFVGMEFRSWGVERDVYPDPRASNNAFRVKIFNDELPEYAGATAEGETLNKLQRG